MFNNFSVLSLVLTTVTAMLVSPVVRAEDPPIKQAPQLDFKQCVTKLQHQAKDQGVSQQIIQTNLATVTRDAKVIEYDRRQPEFSESFDSYFNKRVNLWRIEKGRKMLAEHKKLLLNLQHTYGVPPHYLMSFWGLETNFGTYKGKMSIIRSLVTLACDPRRSEFFTNELMLALKLAQRESLDPKTMLGSWAGAMGHTQFMPSAYMQYAVDGDGDKKVDLWNSIPDALTSAANFLNHLGWKPGFRWGREVSLTEDFGYQNSGMDNAKLLTHWGKMGVSKTNGKSIEAAQIEAALLIPGGHKGPAFLVYDNFSVIMRWNHSQFYAIAVGRLADRISGSGKLHRPPVKTPNITVGQLLALQEKLTTLGFDVGKPDGIMGPATQKGIRQYQFSKKMIADGFPDIAVFASLGIKLEAI
ncbi:MAG: lytic murein transglycosylase [Algicola sp.]|nr:lytic murein transglycosylase [Algicola sp.]